MINDGPTPLRAVPHVRSRRASGRLASWGISLLLAGCASPQGNLIPPPLLPPPLVAANATLGDAERPPTTRIVAVPAPPLHAPALRRAPVALPLSTPAADEPVTLSLEQVSVATFAQIVFADLLKKNVNIDPQVVARKDLVTFRSASAQSPAQIENAAVLLLKSYGISVVDVGGLVRVMPDNASLGSLPEIRRGAAHPDTPLPLRPIFHLVDMQAVRQTDVASWLRTLFGDRIKSQEDAVRNALLISGTPDNVAAALEAIRVLDQPIMAGSQSLAISPAYLSADDLARRLLEVLTAQGYAVQPLGAAPGGLRFPIVLLPVSALNSVFVFARGAEVIAHIENWARTLDRPNERGIGRKYFTYAVRHTDASQLATTLAQLIGGAQVTAPAGAAAPAATATPAAAAAPAASARNSSGSVVVDKATNLLIFQASQDEYAQIVALLQMLDKPSKAALIEVTVAEMSSDDADALGVEWSFTEGRSNGGSVVGGTLGGLNLGTAGLNVRVLNAAGSVKVALNALASTNRARVLSSPRLLARNGESASIQVGQEVPIITSQSSTPTTGTSATVLQTVQYRSTGVILKIRPVIHSGDQVDLDVSQEVSAAASTTTGVSISPTFSNRKLDTKLTLRNGTTVMLGGLISEDSSGGDSGVPILKDIPLLGALFRNQTSAGSRKQLVVLITPYIINNDNDAQAVTGAFRNLLGPWAGSTGPLLSVPPGAPSTATPPADPASAPGR